MRFDLGDEVEHRSLGMLGVVKAISYLPSGEVQLYHVTWVDNMQSQMHPLHISKPTTGPTEAELYNGYEPTMLFLTEDN